VYFEFDTLFFCADMLQKAESSHAGRILFSLIGEFPSRTGYFG
jgi:hypothetical protein